MADVVLDASALLALLTGEPGADEVAALLPGARVSAVNLAETASKLLEAGMPEAVARSALEGLGLVIVPFDGPAAFDTARLRTTTRAAGLSLGDRACLALAGARRLPAVTTDRAWRRARVDVAVRIVPRAVRR